MSRPQKIHPPLKGGFNNILASIAIGSGKGKAAAQRLAAHKPAQKPPANPPKKP